MTEKTHEERISELEQRVYRLEQAIQNDSEKATESVQNDLLDRYDTYVMESIDGDTRPRTARLRSLYQEAGIVDKKKIKRRMKRLDKLGVWE
jgi:hypothetical protein